MTIMDDRWQMMEGEIRSWHVGTVIWGTEMQISKGAAWGDRIVSWGI